MRARKALVLLFTLMMAMAATAPAKRRPGTRMPKPLQMPRFIINADEGSTDASGRLVGAGNYMDLHEVRSEQPLSRFERKHELFHTLDHDELDQSNRVALAQAIAPRRAAEAATNEGWYGDRARQGEHAGLAELAADYYAAAATGLRLKPKRHKGVLTGSNVSAYANLRDRKLKEFERVLLNWARQHR